MNEIDGNSKEQERARILKKLISQKPKDDVNNSETKVTWADLVKGKDESNDIKSKGGNKATFYQ